MAGRAKKLHENSKYPKDQLTTEKEVLESNMACPGWRRQTLLPSFQQLCGPFSPKFFPALSPHILFCLPNRRRMSCGIHFLCVSNESCWFTVLRDKYGLNMSAPFYPRVYFSHFRQIGNNPPSLVIFRYGSAHLQHNTAHGKTMDMVVTHDAPMASDRRPRRNASSQI